MIEGSRILLVDDTPEVIQLLTDFLGPYNCEVFAASTGKEALGLLSGQSIDIAVLDIRLPDTDGLALLDTIRLQDPTIAVVMITGYNDPDLIIEAMKKGASDFLMKPFSIDKLLLVVMRVRKQRDLLLENHNILSDLEDKRKIEVLNRQLETKIAELTKMYHISNKFNSLSIFEDVYEKSVGVVNEILNAEVSGYYIVDHESRQLILYRTKDNGNQKPIEANIPVTPELLEEMRMGKRHFVKNNRAYSSLVIKGECVGALMAGAKPNGHSRKNVFSEEDLYFLKFIADKAAVQIENRMLYESLFESVLHTLTSLIMAINRRDMYTEGHCKRVADMCLALADRIGANEYDKDVARVVAPIHDVGKVGVPDSILLKPGKLTDDEYAIMKSHSVYGEEIINRFDILSNEARITRHHHEAFDGRGYPDRLAGADIPYCSRMIALCDTYDAMTTDRPYRKGMGPKEATAEIKRCRGKQFDPDLTDCFLEMVDGDLRGDERREFFRISDRLLVEFRQVSYEESILIERNLRQTFSLQESAGRHLSETPTIPPFIRDLYSYLEILDRKLNTILDVLSKKDEIFRSRYLDVDISGAGIKFLSDTRLDEGGYIELRIVLPCIPDARISALGRIVRVRPSTVEDMKSFETAVSFAAIGEKDRDLLIGYMFSEERKRLRAEKKP